MADLNRIKTNNFVIIGRAGMDFYADPPGAKTEEAVQFVSALGGSSANIGVAINNMVDALPWSPACLMMRSGAIA